MKRILVALSGGVDSAVAALRLQRQGYAIAGAYMRTWMNEEAVFADCPWKSDLEDARAVARHLNIPFEVINFIDDYRQRIVHYLVEGYQQGITPNPDTQCNREIKFGLLRDYARRKGFDGIATGHYCRKQRKADGSYDILEGIDKNKDQSYFLALVGQQQIQKALFPIGELTKPAVRALARQYGLPNADKKDSQGICFLGKVKINDFLQHYIADQPGDIVTHDGRVVGQHRGLHRYTLGQRRGIGVPSNTDFENFVVIGKDLEHNRLYIAFDHPQNPKLYGQEFCIHSCRYVNETLAEPQMLLAKPRYRDPPQAIAFEPLSHGEAKITFATPQRALAPGQVLALYRDDVLLGGGLYR